MRILTSVVVLSVVALLQVPCHCTVEAFDVGTGWMTAPGKLYRLDENTVVVASRTVDVDAPHGHKAVYAFGTDHGSKWRIVERPLPAGCDASKNTCGVVLPPVRMFDPAKGMALFPQRFLLGGTMPAGRVNPWGMPMWYGGPTGNWNKTTLLNRPITDQVTCNVLSIAQGPIMYGHPPPARIWATGYEEHKDNTYSFRLWCSDDHGATWSNLKDPALARVTYPVILDISPGRWIWGKAGDYYFRERLRCSTFCPCHCCG